MMSHASQNGKGARRVCVQDFDRPERPLPPLVGRWEQAKRPPLAPNRPGDPRIRTFTGRLVNPFAMLAADFDIVDIAHALANTCRFGGHCPEFYSVAQHSVHVASLCDGEARLYGLLHDAAEAYLGDVVGPLKCRTQLTPQGPRGPLCGFESVENVLLNQIILALRLDLPTLEIITVVETADHIMLEREMAHFWRAHLPEGHTVAAMPPCLAPHEAKAEFLRTFYALNAGRAALAPATVTA